MFVVTVVTRPWKNPAARAPLPVVLAIAAAAWALGTGVNSYRHLMTDGAWTGATLAMLYIPTKAIVLSLLAYAAGRTLLKARVTHGSAVQRWALPLGLLGLTVYSVVSDVLLMQRAAFERHARDPALSAEDASIVAARVRSGAASREEIGAFLGNPMCPPDLLDTYGASPDSYWRKAVARNAKIDAPLAERLAGDSDEEVRHYLAFNRSLPPDILSRLASDSSEMVRETVAWTDALPEEAFNRLLEDQSAKVRATVAIQSRVSQEALAKLQNDPEQRVRDAANRRAFQ